MRSAGWKDRGFPGLDCRAENWKDWLRSGSEGLEKVVVVEGVVGRGRHR